MYIYMYIYMYRYICIYIHNIYTDTLICKIWLHPAASPSSFFSAVEPIHIFIIVSLSFGDFCSRIFCRFHHSTDFHSTDFLVWWISKHMMWISLRNGYYAIADSETLFLIWRLIPTTTCSNLRSKAWNQPLNNLLNHVFSVPINDYPLVI